MTSPTGSTGRATGGAPPRFVGRRVLRRVLAGVGAAVSLLLVAVVIALFVVDFGRFVSGVAATVKTRTGRDLTFAASPHVRILPRPAVVLEDVVFANAPWGSRPEMVRVKRADLRLALLPLLSGRIVVQRVLLVQPDVLLETDGQGLRNWEFAAASGQQPGRPAAGGLFPDLRLGEVRVSGGVLVQRNLRTGRLTRLTIDNLRLTRPRGRTDALEANGRISVDGKPFLVSGPVGRLDALFSPGRAFPMELTVRTKGATAVVQGVIQRFSEFKGLDLKIRVAADDFRALGEVLGASWAPVKPVVVQAHISDAEGGFAFDSLRGDFGRSSIAGDGVVLVGGPRPKIVAQLSARTLDLTAFASPARAAGETRRAFSARPLEFGVLRSVDAEGRVQIDKLLLGDDVSAESLSAQVTIADARLAIEPMSFTFSGGRAGGFLHLTAGSTPTFALRLTGRDVGLAGLLHLFHIPGNVSGGPTEVLMDLAGAGPSLHDWAASAHGYLRFVVGAGRVDEATFNRGADVLTQFLSAVNPFRKADPFTDLHCAVVNAPVQDGVIQLDRRLGLETSKIDVAGGGEIDLGREFVDLELHPRSTQGLGLGLADFSGIVRLHGPFGDTRVGATAKGAAKTASEIGAGVMTGGLSVLGKTIYDKLFARSPCKVALNQLGPPAERRAPAPRR